MNALILINRDKADGGALDALRSAGIAGPAEQIDGDRIAERAERAVRDRVELLIVAGGDGSVSAAAGALAGSDTAIAILPLGTLNHFARDLGIPADLGEAARLIARGRPRRVDLGEVNGRPFVNNSAIGLYPLMVLDRESQERRLGRSKRLAMAVAALRTLARFDRHRLTLSVNRRKARVGTPLLFVGNNSYSLELPGAGRRETLDGGELSVMVMRSETRRGFVATVMRALAGRSRAGDLVRLEGVRSLTVDSRRAGLTLSIDGETVQLEPPLRYRIRKRALRVVAP